jgi:hypothetical protein
MVCGRIIPLINAHKPDKLLIGNLFFSFVYHPTVIFVVTGDIMSTSSDSKSVGVFCSISNYIKVTYYLKTVAGVNFQS